MLSSQVLDGPGPQLGLGWRWTFADPWRFIAEVGAVRTVATGITGSVPALGTAALIQADIEQWTIPLLTGFGLAWMRGSSGWSVDLLAGLAVGRTRTLVGAHSAGWPTKEAYVSVDPLVRARLEWSWAVRPGAVTFGGGWQHHFRLGVPQNPDVRITGPFTEVGWRVQF